MLAALTGPTMTSRATTIKASQRNILDPPNREFWRWERITPLGYCGWQGGWESRGLALFAEPVGLPAQAKSGQALALGQNFPRSAGMFLGELFQQLAGVGGQPTPIAASLLQLFLRRQLSTLVNLGIARRQVLPHLAE